MMYHIAVTQWSVDDELAEVIGEELNHLGHQTIYIQPTLTRLPENIDVIFSHGPYGNFLAIPALLDRLPFEQRPIFVHWNTKGLPHFTIPWPLMRLISNGGSWTGRLGGQNKRWGHFLAGILPSAWTNGKMSRFSCLGDYYYAYEQGWLDIFADSSVLFTQLYRNDGLPTHVMPWGATPPWYADLGLERDIDVLWLGNGDSKGRDKRLAHIYRGLRAQDVKLYVADGLENPIAVGQERTELLNRAKITLNLPQTWYDDNFSQFALAASNRSLILSGPLLPHCPAYERGTHFVSAPTERLPETILHYLTHDEERLQIVENAYQLVTTKLSFRSSIEAIMDKIAGLQSSTSSISLPKIISQDVAKNVQRENGIKSPSSARSEPGLKVLMIAPEPFLEPRGTPISVYQRLHALSALGHQVDLLTYHVGKDVNLPGVTIHRIPKISFIKAVKPGPSWTKIILDILLILKAIPMLKIKQYDIIHSHEEAVFFSVILSAMSGTSHLYDMHSSLSQQLKIFDFWGNWLFVKLFEALENWAINRCDAVITIGSDLEERIRDINPVAKHYRLENLAVQTVINHSSKMPVATLRERLGLNGKTTIVYTGNLETHQGIKLLIESAEVVKEHCSNVLFLLVGGQPQQIEYWQNEAKQRGLEDDFIRFVGTVPMDEVLTYLEMAEILVSPRAEGLSVPLKIYSYLHSGKPMVATRLEAHTQVLNDDIALLVTPTKEGLAEGILKLVHAPNLRQRLGQQAQQLARERYGL